MFVPAIGAHVYGSRFSECKECSSVDEHDLRDAKHEIAELEEKIKKLEKIIELYDDEVTENGRYSTPSHIQSFIDKATKC